MYIVLNTGKSITAVMLKSDYYNVMKSFLRLMRHCSYKALCPDLLATLLSVAAQKCM